jgi:peptidoglycan glycosyltransferase
VNAPLRRVGVVVLVLFALLFLNLNWVQAYKADAYRNNEHNGRVQLTEYQRQRGSITATAGRDQVPIAKSIETNDQLKYLRQYPLDPAAFAMITGFKPVNGVATGIERAEDDFLSGRSDALFSERLREMFTGTKAAGGNVLLTINKNVQEKAYNDLVNNQNKVKTGAIVALDPKTGGILAMASIPSYDPNPLSAHSGGKAAYDKVNGDPAKPLLNRAISDTYPPGSTMKVIISAAALTNLGMNAQTVIPAGPTYQPVPGAGNFTIHNAHPSICPDKTITLIEALTQSCNTGFAQLGVQLGADKVKAMAQAFGFEDNGLTLAGKDQSAVTVAASHTGAMTGENGQPDPNAVAQSSIGQLNVKITPMQGALVAATVANGGQQMRPYLVDKRQAPDLTITDQTQPKVLRTPISPEAAGQLQQMMVSVVDHGTGTKAKISGFQVGGKTGTAQNSEDDGDHGWFIGFVMKNGDPICAVAVFLQNAGTNGSSEATRIGGDVMTTVLRERGLK